MVTHITILVLTLACMSCALEAKENDTAAVEKIMEKYFAKLPDVESKFVVNEGISKMISSYFDGKVNVFPLFKVNVKVDRKPVKIPWYLDQADKRKVTKKLKKRYKYIKASATTSK